MLIRYGRSQFLNPNTIQNAAGEPEDDETDEPFNCLDALDPDHRLLLKNAKPLLQSRNSAVVMAVIQLYLYLAPNSELNSAIVRPLIRLLHSKPEIQIVILTNIASLTTTPEDAEQPDDAGDSNETAALQESDDHFADATTTSNQLSLKALFEPLLKSFFVKSKDSTQVRILKLKILTNLSSSYNIPLILREFQAYINNYQDDMEFVSATIEAIGKCASRIKEIASVCLNGLISLLSNRNEAIIAQSIIVIRKQIINKQRQIDRKAAGQTNVGQAAMNGDEPASPREADGHSPADGRRKRKEGAVDKSDHIISLVIKQVSKLIVDKIKTPNAKATVLWILAEFCDKNVKAYQLSPDILRLVAKSFTGEVEIVKLQAINLAAKVYLTTCYFETAKNYFSPEDKERIKLLINYIFNLAKYDLNYDVRDRARFLRQLLNKSNTATGLLLAQKILMAPKNIFIENKPDDLVCAAAVKDGQSNSEQAGHFAGDYDELKEEPAVRPTAAAPSLVNSGMSKYRIGSLSHFLGKQVHNYEELPDFPTERPDPSVRNSRAEEEERALEKELDLASPIKKKSHRADSSSENFYSGESSGLESGSSDSESSSGSSSEEASSESEQETPVKKPMNEKKATAPVDKKMELRSVHRTAHKSEESESEQSSSGSESEASGSSDSGSSESDSSLSSGALSRVKPAGQLPKDKLIKC